MKQFVRSLYAVGLASLIMAGCAKDPSETSGVGGQKKVEFNTNIDREVSVPGSRVNGNQWEYGDQIGVYMLWDGGTIDNPSSIVSESYDRSFENRRFSINYNTGAYNAYDENEAIYFPLTNPGSRSFDFVAYYPYTAKEDMINDFELAVDIKEDKPILTATGESAWYDYTQVGVTVPSVNLNFKHQMARVKLNIVGGEGVNDRDLANMTVTFKNANAKGSYNIATNQFLPTVEKEDVPFVVKKNQPTEEEIEEEILEKEGSVATLIMIPNTAAIDYRTIVFSVGHSENGTGTGVTPKTYEIVYEIPSTVLYSKGKEHVYNVTLTRKEAKFDILSIEDWEPGPEVIVDESEIKTAKERTFFRSMYNPNTYLWASAPRTTSTANQTDSYTIPLMKLFAMWEHDPWLTGLGKAPLAEGQRQMVVEVIWADDPEIAEYTFGFNDAMPTRSSTINITYKKLLATAQYATPMNVMIGVRVSTGEISGGRPVYEDFYRWCWHLWITQGGSTANPIHRNHTIMWDNDGIEDGLVYQPSDLGYDPANPERKQKTMEYRYLRRNLGAKDVEENVSSIGLYYQWGRPTPFPGPKDFNGTMPTLYKLEGTNAVEITGLTEGMTKIIDGEQSGVGFMFDDLESFTAFVTSPTGNWIDPTLNPQLWNGDAKTAWNPCPLGWMVPDYRNKYDANNLLSPWNLPGVDRTSTNPGDYNVAFVNEATKKGYSFTTLGNPATEYLIGWYPASGYRDGATGAISNLGSIGQYWASTWADGGKFTSFVFDDMTVNPYAQYDHTAQARSVRCVKDNTYLGLDW